MRFLKWLWARWLVSRFMAFDRSDRRSGYRNRNWLESGASKQELIDRIMADGFCVDVARRRFHTMLANDDRFVRCDAIGALKRLGITHEMVASILRALSDEGEWSLVRTIAANTLEAYGDEPELVVPALCNATRAQDEAVRKAAMKALGRYGKSAAVAAADIAKNLLDPLVACQTAESLSNIVKEEDLDLDDDTRFLYYVALGDKRAAGKAKAMERDLPKSFLPLLERFLLSAQPWSVDLSPGADAFLNAITVYSDLGGIPDRKLSPHLVALISKDFSQRPIGADVARARKIAIELMRKRTPDLPELVEQLRTPGWSRKEAISTCARTGAGGPELVSALAAAASDSSDRAGQRAAIDYLGELGGGARGALGTLRRMKEEAGRPVKRTDFRSDEWLFKEFGAELAIRQLEKIRQKIGSGVKVDQDIYYAVTEAISKIERSAQ